MGGAEVAWEVAAEGLREVIGRSAWMALTIGVHIAFWTTLAFVIGERCSDTTDVRRSLGADWTPDQLPDRPQRSYGSLGELVTNTAFLAVFAVAIVWQQVRPPIEGDDGERHSVLDPDLWSFWLPLVLVLLAAEAAFEVVKYRTGGWSVRLAAVNVVLGAVFTAPIVYLAATDRLLNPEGVAAIQERWAEHDPGVVNTVVVVVALVIWAWDSVDGWRRTRTD